MNSTTLDCQSSSCYFALERTGQRVNGPCRCLSDLSAPVRSLIRMTLLAKLNHERRSSPGSRRRRQSFRGRCRIASEKSSSVSAMRRPTG